jgi:hypothetical protein
MDGRISMKTENNAFHLKLRKKGAVKNGVRRPTVLQHKLYSLFYTDTDSLERDTACYLQDIATDELSNLNAGS